jgi:tetratricopeptide (TPR) repeat protein
MKPVLVVALLAVASSAYADSAADARAHYERATSHFAVGEFAQAAEEYQAAFKLKPDPALLYNAAQAYRLAGNNDRALILYKNYVQLYPNEANIDSVRDQIAKLKAAIAAADQAKANPPTTPTEPKAASSPIQPRIQASVPEAPAPSAEKRAPIYKRWWLWTAVGVVVAGGVVTAAVLATRPTSWSQLPDVGPGASRALVQW